jgi:hypothetical protein
VSPGQILQLLAAELGTALWPLNSLHASFDVAHVLLFKSLARKSIWLQLFHLSQNSTCLHIALVGLPQLALTDLCQLKLATISTTSDDRVRALENEDTPRLIEDKVLRMVNLQTETKHVVYLEHILIMGFGSSCRRQIQQQRQR